MENNYPSIEVIKKNQDKFLKAIENQNVTNGNLWWKDETRQKNIMMKFKKALQRKGFKVQLVPHYNTTSKFDYDPYIHPFLAVQTKEGEYLVSFPYSSDRGDVKIIKGVQHQI